MAWWVHGAVSAGKRGMVRAGGSASRIIGDQGTIDAGGGVCASPVTRSQPIWGSPVGHVHGSGWSSSTQAFSPLGSHPPVFPSGIHKQDNRRMPALAQPVLGQRDRVVPDSPIRMGGSSPSLVPPVSRARRPRRGMRPAGWNSRSPKKLSGDYVATDNGVVPDGKTSEVGKMDSFLDGLVVKRDSRVVPSSGDEGMSHPEGMSSGGAPERNEPESYRDYVPPRDVTGDVFGLNDAAVLTPAIAGEAAPVDLAGTGVPAVNGMEIPDHRGGSPD